VCCEPDRHAVRQQHERGLADLRPVDDDPPSEQLDLLLDLQAVAKEVDIADPQT